jgi:hypothetical protein
MLDWLPTLMHLATNNSWTGSLRQADLDGYDMWSAIVNGEDSPRHVIVHGIRKKSSSVQLNMLKYDVNIKSAHRSKPNYKFYDLDDDEVRRFRDPFTPAACLISF